MLLVKITKSPYVERVSKRRNAFETRWLMNRFTWTLPTPSPRKRKLNSNGELVCGARRLRNIPKESKSILRLFNCAPTTGSRDDDVVLGEITSENEVELTQLNHRRTVLAAALRSWMKYDNRDGNSIRIIISQPMRPASRSLKIHKKPAEAFCCCASGSISGFDSAAFMSRSHYSSLLYNFLSILERSLRQSSACTHSSDRFFVFLSNFASHFFPRLLPPIIHRTLETRKICSAHCCGHLNLPFLVVYAQKKSDFTTLHAPSCCRGRCKFWNKKKLVTF